MPRSGPHFGVPVSAAGLTPDGEPWHRLEHHHGSSGLVAGSAVAEGLGSLRYRQDVDLWWPGVPEDARLSLEAGWPELGAPTTTTVLVLENLDDLHERVVRLG